MGEWRQNWGGGSAGRSGASREQEKNIKPYQRAAHTCHHAASGCVASNRKDEPGQEGAQSAHTPPRLLSRRAVTRSAWRRASATPLARPAGPGLRSRAWCDDTVRTYRGAVGGRGRCFRGPCIGALPIPQAAPHPGGASAGHTAHLLGPQAVPLLRLAGLQSGRHGVRVSRHAASCRGGNASCLQLGNAFCHAILAGVLV